MGLEGFFKGSDNPAYPGGLLTLRKVESIVRYMPEECALHSERCGKDLVSLSLFVTLQAAPSSTLLALARRRLR